jgi:hypothetical protein
MTLTAHVYLPDTWFGQISRSTLSMYALDPSDAEATIDEAV